jgi:hypothetical protein
MIYLNKQLHITKALMGRVMEQVAGRERAAGGKPACTPSMKKDPEPREEIA